VQVSLTRRERYEMIRIPFGLRNGLARSRAGRRRSQAFASPLTMEDLISAAGSNT
jgi:hypothetical protein